MRQSGVILHVTSLPSPYGVGTLGKAAYAFIDFLKAAGQGFWQVLPLGPTGFGDSPYQGASAFAGNPYLIDLEALMREGLLTREELTGTFWGAQAASADFGALYENRPRVLRAAFGRFRPDGDYERFVRAEASWLDDYSLFMACKEHFGGVCWAEWPRDIRLHEPEGVVRYAGELARGMDYHRFLQYEFFRQWDALHAYALRNGVRLLGDVPIYVPLDCADVWAESRWFELDGEGRPKAMAGVPPDHFSETGQLWGNPLYDWEALAANGFNWWLRRLRVAARLFDRLRIDHFRGLESFWAVPAGEETAKAGVWRKGPGLPFIQAVKEGFPDTEFLAEDLGHVTPEVQELRQAAGWPGMKVLEFAFEPWGSGMYLPHNCGQDSVCYTGTHDNAPLAQWLRQVRQEELSFARAYLGLSREEGYCAGILRGGLSSPAGLFMAQMQDWLELGAEARMNTPGTLGGLNWRWRMTPGQASAALAARMRAMTSMYGRADG